jgi:signal transduction histidine kinase
MNSIAPVTSLTDTLLFAFRKDEPYEEDSLMQNTVEALQTINSTAKGLISFVNSYRRFTGIPKPQLNPVSLQSVIERAIVLEAAVLQEKGISVTLHLPDESTVRQVDESQIMQVLLNLLKNASEAIPGEEGQIRIELMEENEKITWMYAITGNPSQKNNSQIFLYLFHNQTYRYRNRTERITIYYASAWGTLTHFNREGWTVFRMAFYHSSK